MTDKGLQQQTLFHNYTRHQRLNNPTYNSSFVHGSMSLFQPQKAQPKQQCSEYKNNFEPLGGKLNTLGAYQQQQQNYGKYSKDAFEKSRSYLSQYGTNSLGKNASESVFRH